MSDSRLASNLKNLILAEPKKKIKKLLRECLVL